MSIIDPMPTIQAGGLATYYEQVGSGPLLVLLHGWANGWEAWLPIIPYLSDHFTLVMPDLPGCGKTETPKEGWDTQRHADWLSQFLHSLSSLDSTLSSLCVVGHSYGGKILLEYCSGNYQPQPKKIILMDASGIPAVLNKKQQTLARLAVWTPSFIKAKLTTKMRTSLYKQFGAESDYISANPFQSATLKLVLAEDYTSKLAHIEQQTLLLWGKNDESTPLWQGETMQQLIPMNKMVTYDAGHFPHHTYPTKVSEEIVKLLL